MKYVVIILVSLLAAASGQGKDEYAPLKKPGKDPGERQVITVEKTVFPFRWCPPGSFLMGSPKTERNRDDSEVQHRVTLTKGFWMLETEVSQEMYRLIVGHNPSEFKGERLPVDSVSWYDAISFCEMLSKRIGVTPPCSIRLPSEAQWEYAARAGTTGPYAGNLDQLAWYGQPRDSGRTRPVGTKSPNPWGLYDMHGNLWEWCHDLYADFDGQDAVDPIGPNSAKGDVRIDRGGCWDSTPDYCRAAHRGVYEPDRKGPFVGFRIVFVP